VSTIGDFCEEKGLYKPHSFRIGGATEAKRLGFDDDTIMQWGRWSSNAYKKYIRLDIKETTEFRIWFALSTFDSIIDLSKDQDECIFCMRSMTSAPIALWCRHQTESFFLNFMFKVSDCGHEELHLTLKSSKTDQRLKSVT
jgi:hypothetical protein